VLAPEVPSPSFHGMAAAGLHLAIGNWRSLSSALALPLGLKGKVTIVRAGHSGRRILDAIRRRPHTGLSPEMHNKCSPLGGKLAPDIFSTILITTCIFDVIRISLLNGPGAKCLIIGKRIHPQVGLQR
jgi:hypothetical protein